MLRSATLLGVILGAASLVAGAQRPEVKVEPAHLDGPRPLADQTAKSVVRDYLESWQVMRTAMEQNRPGILGADFVGMAKEKLTGTIHDQAAAGIHTRYVDRSHDLRIAFYSPDGLSIELTDTADYDVQIFDHDKQIATRQVHGRYVVVMTPAQVRWMVRVFQAEECGRNLGAKLRSGGRGSWFHRGIRLALSVASTGRYVMAGECRGTRAIQ